MLVQSLYPRLLKLFHLDKILRGLGGSDYDKLCSGCLYRLMLAKPSLEAVWIWICRNLNSYFYSYKAFKNWFLVISCKKILHLHEITFLDLIHFFLSQFLLKTESAVKALLHAILETISPHFPGHKTWLNPLKHLFLWKVCLYTVYKRELFQVQVSSYRLGVIWQVAPPCFMYQGRCLLLYITKLKGFVTVFRAVRWW